ncbi:hypothetical protein LO80_03440 [Candidatus Francisella endociliophora]|uniref:Uncharacterized protein n=1 Tax=Candidatus Francisella endociliophora TaxID=653937 RepID=A0A097ENG9_9GAMM|nr:hypothetical protein [Francisella sp. FSC1006]AIT09112.1 hypothetical protein LO80_03440 [Francisella sp. FSC1006]
MVLRIIFIVIVNIMFLVGLILIAKNSKYITRGVSDISRLLINNYKSIIGTALIIAIAILINFFILTVLN